MQSDSGGTQTTTLAARQAITDASAEPEFKPDFSPDRVHGEVGVDLDDDDIDLGLKHPALREMEARLLPRLGGHNKLNSGLIALWKSI